MKKLAQEFISQMEVLLGKDETERLVDALQGEQPVSIRLNPFKPFPRELNGELVLWCDEGRYLAQRPSFTFDPLFHAGCYYVQEASSMFLSYVIRQFIHTPVWALDLCAAPGGKSTLLRSSLPQGSVLVCNEIMRGRAQVLSENMVKWGHPDMMVTNNASEDFTNCQNAFDVILADVPCSGEGMFRKDDEAIDCWSLENVQMCAVRQRHLIYNIWPALKPGGILVYSTCTYNAEEDERNMAWMMQEFDAEVLPVDVPQGVEVVGNLIGEPFPVYHFMQHKVRGEGFFLCVLRKPMEIGFKPFYLPDIAKSEKEKKKKKSKVKLALPVKDILQTVHSWVQMPDNYHWVVDENGVRAIPLPLAPFYEWSTKHGLKVMEAGIEVATLKGKDLVPSHALAMSIMLNPTAFPQQELDIEQAIAYLRKEVIILPNAPKGFVIVTHQGLPLGFVKNVGNRANNLYPQEWRIRSSYNPEEPNVI